VTLFIGFRVAGELSLSGTATATSSQASSDNSGALEYGQKHTVSPVDVWP
jgi:hypothetical protein